jgi:hypothetical protein
MLAISTQGFLMQPSRSDAYYLAQLFERLQFLETELARKIGAGAELTARSNSLLKDLQHLLRQGDDQALDILEYSLIPKINRLLLDARQQLKLKKAVSASLGTYPRRNNPSVGLPAPLHPHPLPYKPIPMPLRDEERHTLIEDALGRLKMLLSEP